MCEAKKEDPPVISPMIKFEDPIFDEFVKDIKTSGMAHDCARILNVHKRDCERSGNYDAAEVSADRLKRLRYLKAYQVRFNTISLHSSARNELVLSHEILNLSRKFSISLVNSQSLS